ncbi:hypothetical protein BCR44DRAFT_1101170 [Catenaria anguillulae PL171]|uniref:Cora-like Mg2+ transporter protein-domain-containing protein n=1 Tax=Catenaria anguillulae PL171 TaxID=765915 RepID=A0A1Y2I1V9_9FUNG|nr:hypothetical protein BCR44DRAFT_1101170 [Catenaria anguillulae PL171]
MRAKNKFIHRHHHHHAADETSVHRVPGAAPGIDIESESIDKYFSERLVGQVNGMVVDFNAETYQIRQGLANADLCDWISKPRPDFSAVRWIHVEGMAWDVIKTVSQIHGLHPLSIEDALHLPQRVKVDNFSNHLFISLLVCRLASLTSDVAEIDVAARHRLLKQRLHPMAESGECTLLDIEADNCSMFLLDDGTLITFTHFASGFLVEPILSRLTNATTMLRSLSDASFLLNALIDSIVDHYLPITEAYADQFERLEAIVFEKPNIHIIRYLHATHADLIELKQKLLPVQTLIRNLRTMSHRVASSPTRPASGSMQRPASFIGASSTTVLPDGSTASAAASKETSSGSNAAPKVAQERLSPICKTYLSDVQDHIDTCLDHVSTLQGWAQNLTDLAFNCISYTTNENMKVLTIASVVFLPITFLAGVYGTNFTFLPELSWTFGYPLFWTACIVLVTVTLVYLKRRGFY